EEVERFRAFIPGGMAEFDGVAIIFWQDFEKFFEARGTFFHERRQLPEDWTGAVFQGFEAAEIFSQALAGAADFQDVRDEAAAFDGEDKAGRRLVAPAADHFERG